MPMNLGRSSALVAFALAACAHATAPAPKPAGEERKVPASVAPSLQPPVSASASASVVTTPSLPVPRAVVVTLGDPAIRARVLSAAVGDAFPWKPSPSLSGPLRGLAFGMSEDEARAAAPSFAAAFEIYGAKSTTAAQWLPIGAGRGRVRIYARGVDMIEIVHADEQLAKSTLEGAWGKPRVGDSSFDWHVWTNPEHSIRAVLMRGDGGALTRLELLPYRPLAELMADGGELSWKGKHLLDCTMESLAPALRVVSGEDVQMLPIELSSGHIPLRVTAKNGVVSKYTVGIDFTYDHAIDGEVRMALRKHFGAPEKEPLEPPSKKECLRFPATTSGIRARACVIYKQWQITVGRDGDELVP